MKPNLFAYATKELSQDAMICWLIEWSVTAAGNETDKALRDLGREFVEALLGKHGVKLRGAIRHAEIRQQKYGIDVLVRIHDEDSAHVILIEDKTHSSAHGDQLWRYRDVVAGGNTSLGKVPEHWPVYLKTGNQSLAEDGNIEKLATGSFAAKTCWRFLMATREGIRLSWISGNLFRDSRTTSIALTIGATEMEEKNGHGQAGRNSIGALRKNSKPKTDMIWVGAMSTPKQAVFLAFGGPRWLSATRRNFTFNRKLFPGIPNGRSSASR